jgi:L-iditol 2-dehydrogenase
VILSIVCYTYNEPAPAREPVITSREGYCSMAETMWARRLAGPGTFERITVSAPSADDLADGQVLLRVLAGGICGSDIPYFRGAHPLPDVDGLGRYSAELPGYPMHEVVGEVLGSRHRDVAVGSRVVGWARGMNGLAELVITRGDSVADYEAALDPTVAVMLQPLACVLAAAQQLAGVDGSSVAVIGQGPIGLLFSHVLRSLGAARITGIDRVPRHDVAAQFGVDEAIHSSSDWWARSLGPDSDRPGIVVEAVGHQVRTLTDAVLAAADGGQIFYFGIPDDAVYPMPMADFLRKNLRLTSGVTRDRRAALQLASAYLARHPDLPAAYVTHVFDVADAQRAYSAAASPAPGRLKVVIAMDRG